MSITDIASKIKEIDSYAKTVLNDSRYSHSLRVADYANILAKEYNSEAEVLREAMPLFHIVSIL